MRLAVPQDVAGDDEEPVGDGDDYLLVAAALDEPAVLGREVGVAFPDGTAGALDQALATIPRTRRWPSPATAPGASSTATRSAARGGASDELLESG